MTSCSFRSFWRQASLPCLLCAAAWSPGVARAEPVATDLATAKQAFESAVKLESEEHWADAAAKLRQAITVKDTPGLRFHLAHCEVEQGHLVEASLEYDRASELLRQGAKAPDVQKLLGPTSDALKSRIPRVTVELPADLSAPSATIDGKPYPSSELAQGVPLNPGRHTLRVAAAGRRPFEQVLMLQEAQPVTVQPRLSLAPPPVAPSSDPPRRLAVLPASPAPVPVPASAPVPAPARKTHVSSAELYLLIGESVLTAAGLAVGIGGQLAASFSD